MDSILFFFLDPGEIGFAPVKRASGLTPRGIGFAFHRAGRIYIIFLLIHQFPEKIDINQLASSRSQNMLQF